MAITLKFDSDQLQSLVNAINYQTEIIDVGFTDLIQALDGDRSDAIQEKIDQLAASVRAVKNRLQTSIDSQTKTEGD